LKLFLRLLGIISCCFRCRRQADGPANGIANDVGADPCPMDHAIRQTGVKPGGRVPDEHDNSADDHWVSDAPLLESFPYPLFG
jgi:hypothetical protein